MSEELHREKIKQRLKDADIYEENMSEDLMGEFYEAVVNSETSLIEEKHKTIKNPLDEAEKSLNESADELLEAINNSESVAPSNKKGNDTFSVSKNDEDASLDAFSEDILNRLKSRKKEEANNNNNNIDIEDDKPEKSNDVEAILDIKNTPIGFNDMPRSENIKKDMLKIISHELKFINIQNSKKFLTSNSETRIKMLCNYHIAATRLKAHFASLSTIMAPMGKSITATDDLCINPLISSLKEEELLHSETTYISRSGRLTKRKVYNEVDESSQDSLSNAKKSKNDDDWLSKSISKDKMQKTIVKAKDSSDKNVSSLTEKTPNKTVITRSDSPDSSQNDIFATETKVSKFDELKESSPIVLKPRAYQRKQLSNDDIMSRSSLFKDTTLKKGRTGALLNAAKEETEKKKLQEDQMEKFKNSLDLDSQAFDDESEKIIVDDDVDVFERKRVIPTVPSSRRPIHGKKRGGGAGPEPLGISTKRSSLTPNLEEINNSPIVNGNNRRPSLQRRTSSNTDSRGEPSTSSISRGKKEVNMTPCPLCSLSFPLKEIEEHAATCGEDMFAQAPQPKLSRITCEVCDQVVPLTTEYEVHVKECIAKKTGGNGFH